jgi:hypothetical protein
MILGKAGWQKASRSSIMVNGLPSWPNCILGAYEAEQKKKDGAIKIKRERFSKSSGNGNTVTVLAALTTFRNLKLEAVLQYAV